MARLARGSGLRATRIDFALGLLPYSIGVPFLVDHLVEDQLDGNMVTCLLVSGHYIKQI